jgi:pyridoxamine 5'-phosphate oxidase family protein
MNTFGAAELAYLRERRLGRIATVGPDGTPHVTPVGWRLVDGETAIEVGGIEPAKTKKFRDVARTGRAAIVIDDIVSTDPWRVRRVEIRGRAEALPDDGGRIRIHPDRVVSWGLDTELG